MGGARHGARAGEITRGHAGRGVLAAALIAAACLALLGGAGGAAAKSGSTPIPTPAPTAQVFSVSLAGATYDYTWADVSGVGSARLHGHPVVPQGDSPGLDRDLAAARPRRRGDEVRHHPGRRLEAQGLHHGRVYRRALRRRRPGRGQQLPAGHGPRAGLQRRGPRGGDGLVRPLLRPRLHQRRLRQHRVPREAGLDHRLDDRARRRGPRDRCAQDGRARRDVADGLADAGQRGQGVAARAARGGDQGAHGAGRRGRRVDQRRRRHRDRRPDGHRDGEEGRHSGGQGDQRDARRERSRSRWCPGRSRPPASR